ncbi:AAA family ATPase [Mycolicibacterium lacusdiani]|uniref:AAA family ATPase n=1 Tax=Mycolicibacterium lacusdiani TaxID=2895283 RepID=UPI001F15DFB5|nr:AAA family ATPase [Mycolicibacterium lacusdiani]
MADLHVEFTFGEAGAPIPHVFVGRNGSGKSNLLSIIADAIIEAAAVGYTDIVNHSGPEGRAFFRVVGGDTIRFGSRGSFSALRFMEAENAYFYREVAGEVDAEAARSQTPQSMHPAINWSGADVKNIKSIDIDEKSSTDIFKAGVYGYFPSTRSESPHWLNLNAVPTAPFDVTTRLQGRLGRPLFVEHALDRFQQWLLTVIMESRGDIAIRVADGNVKGELAQGDALPRVLAAQGVLQLANAVLRIVMNDPTARFVWMGRHSPRKIAVATGNPIEEQVTISLRGMSGGQASLLALFGTLIMDGDAANQQDSFVVSGVKGVVVIDEIDAHMHVDLQTAALPRLIALFPNLQFVLSSHSPLFALGMEKTFTPSGVRIINLPQGMPISAEAYEEFGRAMEAFADTKAFGDAVTNAAQHSQVPIVWLAGETDPLYFRTAVQVLNYELLSHPDTFRWIGYREGPGKTSNTGDSALNKAFNLFKAHPNIVDQPMVLLYDSDANKPQASVGNVNVLSIPLVANDIAKRGIENLLPPAVFTDDVYDERTEEKEYGNTVAIRELNKMRLCEKLCAEAEPEVFANFRPVLDLIQAVLSPQPGETPATGPT